jgi:hypothetical protein
MITPQLKREAIIGCQEYESDISFQRGSNSYTRESCFLEKNGSVKGKGVRQEATTGVQKGIHSVP